MLTRTGRWVLAAAAGLYLAAWGFGTEVMFPVAVGLAVAPALAYIWVRALSQPMRLRRTLATHELVEGATWPSAWSCGLTARCPPGRRWWIGWSTSARWRRQCCGGRGCCAVAT